MGFDMKAILKDKKIVKVEYAEYLEWLKLSGGIVALTKIDGFTIQTNLIQKESEFNFEYFRTSLISAEGKTLHIKVSSIYDQAVDDHVKLIKNRNIYEFNKLVSLDNDDEKKNKQNVHFAW
jgi:hypothetical protein